MATFTLKPAPTAREMSRVARLLADRKRSLGLTLDEMAAQTGLGPAELSKLLRGKGKRLGWLRASRVARWLGKDGVDELFGRQPGATAVRFGRDAIVSARDAWQRANRERGAGTLTVEEVAAFLGWLEAKAKEGLLNAAFLSNLRSLLERGMTLEGIERLVAGSTAAEYAASIGERIGEEQRGPVRVETPTGDKE